MDRAYNKVTNEILYAYQVKRQGDEFITIRATVYI